MKLLIFSVHDMAVKAYLHPFYARSKGEAIRMFSQAANNPEQQFAKNAGDFAMFYLGEFDDNSGSFEPCLVPERVITAFECLDDAPLSAPKRGLPM